MEELFLEILRFLLEVAKKTGDNAAHWKAQLLLSRLKELEKEMEPEPSPEAAGAAVDAPVEGANG